jgi:hypothetical protein
VKNDGCNINLITICVVDNQIKIYFVGWDIISIVINWQHQKMDTKTNTFWNHVDNQVDEKRKYQCKLTYCKDFFIFTTHMLVTNLNINHIIVSLCYKMKILCDRCWIRTIHSIVPIKLITTPRFTTLKPLNENKRFTFCKHN